MITALELQSVYDHAPVGLCVIDPELRWVRINHALAEMNGYPADAHVGRHIRELLPDLADELEPMFQRILETGEPLVGVELVGETPAQPGVQRIWVENFYPLFDHDRRVIGINIVCEEVTEKRRRERAMEILAEAGKVLTASFDVPQMLAAALRLLIPEVAVVVALDLAASDAELSGELHVACESGDAEAILREDRRRRPLAPDHPIGEVHRARRTRVLSGEPEIAAGITGDVELRARLGRLRLSSAILTPILSHGRSLGVLTVVSARPHGDADIALAEELGRRVGVAVENARLFEMAQTERRRAEEANRAKDEFLGMVSHELRTPLSAMLGWVSMLRARQLPPETQARGLETIERNARVQTQLIEDLLDITRITTGKLRLHVEPVDLVRVSEAALDALRPAAEARGVRLLSTFDPGAALVMGDADRLQQVAWNLLSNAVKFTERGGQVWIILREAGSAAELVVEDTGQGIDPDFLPYVFERFRQGEGGTTRAHGGLGLGLTIVKHLVELHGGTITAHSEGRGRGARFTVRLPLSPLTAARPVSPRSLTVDVPVSRNLPRPPGVAGLRVLVVDDDADARELIAAVLEERGMKPTCASSASGALALLLELRPDILVSDIGMPIEDGFSLIEKVRALPPEQGGGTPAVALTAYARVEDRTRALLAGFNMHLTKPVDPAELIVVLASLGPTRP